MLRNIILALILLLIHLWLLFSMDFYMPMDGPAHLYSSKVFLELIKGNELYESIFEITKFLIPNYTTYGILSLLHTLFSGIIVEKVFLVIHVIVITASIVFFARQINPYNLAYLFIFYFNI